MKIVEINSVNYGSTGNIMIDIANISREKGYTVYTFSSCGNDMKKNIDYHNFIGNIISRRLSKKFAYYTGLSGCFSFFATKKLLRKITAIKPDIIHIHNIHSEYINVPLLFNFIKKKQIKTIWTLHDCWAFTGHCPHFDMIKCNKWVDGCYNCNLYKDYPVSYFDNSKFMWKLKKKWFNDVSNLTIVTPSKWLADLVKQSYLNSYSVKVINNGINLSIFKPIKSDFRTKFNISDDKFILLGVSFGWCYRKGLDVFIELEKKLDNQKYQIVLVGVDDLLKKELPKNIVTISRTHNQQELAEIYSSADVFVNPTREDNYPTVNMEAIACGTPVITFNTGGSVEIPDSKSGLVVPKDDINAMYNAILNVCNNKPFSVENCLERAKSFDKNISFEKYIDLYNQMFDNQQE